MTLLTIDQDPSTSDTILFDILTPGADGCPPVDADANNTYMVSNVTIYYVERDFTIPDDQEIEYDYPHPNQTLQAAADQAKLVACQNPTAANVSAAAIAQNYATQALTTTPFYYKDVNPVAVFGSPDFPAWLRTDPTDSILQPFVNADGSIDPGHFTLTWSPDDAREGDFFICWTWSPLPAGDTISAHQPFYLLGDTAITTAIPTHYTVPGKYSTLLSEYLPSMFEAYLSPQDVTPDVLNMFHAALAKGFTDIENLANQIIDLLDANVTQEALLPYLSNLFSLKLRSDDPTLWRRQIKNAVPLFKQKGTLQGLTTALAQAGTVLNKYSQLWQVVSQYTYTDMFFVSDPATLTFTLTDTLYAVDANFQLLYRQAGQSNYLTLSSSYVAFSTDEGVTTMAWMGQTQSPRYVLNVGDLIVVKYLTKAIPSGRQSNENYLQSLDLADQRDALDPNGNLLIPLKNWNVHVIEEDDPMFSALIPTKQPYADPVVFGHVRSEMVYSEQIYGNDVYDGGLYKSTDPCDIDVNFIDDCGACASSEFVLDVEVQELSDDKIQETQEIVTEFTPFHSQMHHMNVNTVINEFMLPQMESVEFLLNIHEHDTMFAGNANNIFTRWHYQDYTLNGVPWSEIQRNVLADTEIVIPSATGNAFNENISLYCPDVRFDQLPISNKTVMEVLAPSANAGAYSVNTPDFHTVQVVGALEPLNQSQFTFRVSNTIYTNPSANLSQADYFELNDPNVNFGALTPITTWDLIHQNGITGSAWSVVCGYGTFTIADVSPDGNLVLSDPNRYLPTTSTGISYTIVDDSMTVTTSNSGLVKCQRRGQLQLPDVNLTNVNEVTRIGYYVYYAGNQYVISGFVPDTTDSVYLDAYTLGGASGVPITVYHRRADNEIGYFNYMGLYLDAGYDIEAGLNIQNGSNPPAVVLDDSLFMESFLVVIGGAYYKITGADSNILTLSGPFVEFTTTGTSVTYSVIRLVNQSVNIDGNQFDFIDRRGVDLAFITIDDQPEVTMLAAQALNSSDGSGIMEATRQEESVTFMIDYGDGKSEKVQL